MIFPLVQELSYTDPVSIFSHFSHQYGSVFLDSALQQGELGRYSYIAAEPFSVLRSKNGQVFLNDVLLQEDPFTALLRELKKYPQPSLPGLPAFQGGVAGFMGYELFQHLEKIPFASQDDMQFPDMMLGLYDVVLAFDHLERKAWIISSGYPEQDLAKRKIRAESRAKYFLQKTLCTDCMVATNQILPRACLVSAFNKYEYCAAVQRVKDYILAGDIFQANLTQRFSINLPPDYVSFDLYKRLRVSNPATFAAYVNFGNTQLVSASPERFIKLKGRAVETRPIKGTRRRGTTREEDQIIAQELLSSAKDNAENVMIVDLLRNDLSRVCEPGSVTVSQLCGLESFATVHHLVSVVHGQLRSNVNAVNLLQATFPGGSITGAPKIRAMEIISELEPHFRGPYCGSVGYISWGGDMDTSIAIRTICIQSGVASFQVGGGIVADSIPEDEYEETLVKGQALMRALVGEA